MAVPDTVTRRAGLCAWFAQSPGRSLLAVESYALRTVWPSLYGKVAVQLGCVGPVDLRDACNAPVRALIDLPGAPSAPVTRVHGEPEALPFDSRSVDLMLLRGAAAALAGVLFLVVPTGAVKAWQLPDTGQEACYALFSPFAEAPCPGSGQDGAYTIVPPRFTDNGNGTVTDSRTGLIWQQMVEIDHVAVQARNGKTNYARQPENPVFRVIKTLSNKPDGWFDVRAIGRRFDVGQQEQGP